MAVLMKKEQKYIQDLKKCAGMYVAESNHRVIACGHTIREVRQKARKKNIKNPRIYPVPKAPKGHLFF